MDDLISRQAAIDALRMDISIIPFAKAREYVRAAIETIYNRLEELPPAQPEPIKLHIDHALTEDEIKNLKHKIADSPIVFMPSAQPEQRWISVSERLPERGKDVLVTRDYDGREDCNKSCRYVEIASRYGEDDDPDWTSFSDEYKMHPKNHHVIAWRELPESYKGGRDGQ